MKYILTLKSTKDFNLHELLLKTAKNVRPDLIEYYHAINPKFNNLLGNKLL